MPLFARELEGTLHDALKAAADRHHEFATLEHLLIALIDDPQASQVLDACGVNRDDLRKDVTEYLDNQLTALDVRPTRAKKRKTKKDKATLDSFDKTGPTPTSGFQRVVQRSILHVQSAGRQEVNGSNVLVALFSERESYAVYFLSKHEISRLDAITYIAHGVSKNELGPIKESDAASGSAISDRINRVFRDDLKVVADIIPHKPALTTPKIAEKITELAIDLVEQSAAVSANEDTAARPLITIGIYGPWGSGKSTLLRAVGAQMTASGFVTVHINTWKWDGNEDVYAFMNRELLRSLSNIPGIRWRALFIKALLKTRSNIKRLGVWSAVIGGAIVAGIVVDWGALTTAQLAKGTLAGVITTGVIVALAKPLIGLVEKIFLIEPENIDARQSLSKSYRYLDFVRRYTRSKRKGPIVFLFDDLDRCDNKIVVDFVRSIHSLTSDGSLCVIACDEEFTSAAIYAQYKQVADYLEEGKEFGKRFLEKIIQVPFRLPEVFREDLREIGLLPISEVLPTGVQALGVGLAQETDLAVGLTKDLGERTPEIPVSEARLWEICGNTLALVVEPAGLEIRQAKMLSNVVKLYSMVFPPIDEISAERLAAFLVANYVDSNWIPSRYFGNPEAFSVLDPVEAELRIRLGDDAALLARMYRMFGFRRSFAQFATSSAAAKLTMP